MWRMVDDVWDTWGHIAHLMNVCEQWYHYIGTGTWPDCDMIPLGRISIRGERGEERMTRLTPKEQYTLMTLFSIFKSPLFFGGDLPSNDEFTRSLLTNSEVLKMHKESSHVRQLFQKDGKVAITSVNNTSGDTYLALFNMSDSEQTINVEVVLASLGLEGEYQITNMWTGEQMGKFSASFGQDLPAHASGLFCIRK